MKKHQDIHKIIDNALENHSSGEIDNEEANTIHKLVSDKISLVREHIKHKKLTGDPSKLVFFNDN